MTSFIKDKILLLLLLFLYLNCNAQKADLPIYQSSSFSVFPDKVVQNNFLAKALSPNEMISNYQSLYSLKDKTDSRWLLSKDIRIFPQYHSDYLISDAIYNLSLEEMQMAIEKDSTFRTGKEWGGVWTRDISYSIILSMAYLQPRVAINSLLKKVNKKLRIIQDTGTGGAYPCSTDRMIWAVAAWEVYKVTGDINWLKQAYIVIKNSIDDDLQNVYDPKTGLVKGESSFLDWREETYPKWMQPADIFESECLGTNAVHYQANIVLSRMAILLHQKDVADKHKLIANKIKQGINKHLWLPDKKYYAQYLYGRNYKIVSPRSEALGEALCILFGIADQEKAKQIVENTPLTNFGISCIYPQIPGISPYHNNAIWPFVQTYWLWAAAKTGNDKAVLEGIVDIYRPAALFLTNKENFVADNGDYGGTQINSSVMLWSLSGNISIVHKVLFGLHFGEDKLSFTPYVPVTLAGKRTLSNFKYRQATLNIEMEGYGNKIKTFLVDGNVSNNFFIPSGLKGLHTIKILLQDNENNNTVINKVTNYASVKTPQLYFTNDTLKWNKIASASFYKLIINGKNVKTVAENYYAIKEKGYNEYSVITVDSSNVESFVAEPLNVYGNSPVKIVDIKLNDKDFSERSFLKVSKTTNIAINIPISADEDGLYSIDVKYANGNGPINTENKCAIRLFKIDDKKAGTFVFPQRGTNDWNSWGYSNPVRIFLKKGNHIASICFNDFNDNMNGEINEALLSYIRITKLNSK